MTVLKLVLCFIMCAGSACFAQDDDNPCKNYNCEPGMVCQISTVKCIQEPCYPPFAECVIQATSCVGVICPFGEICRRGKCVEYLLYKRCGEATCSLGQMCRNNRCVDLEPGDPCKYYECPEGQTCHVSQPPCVPGTLCPPIRAQCKSDEPISDVCTHYDCPRGQECEEVMPLCLTDTPCPHTTPVCVTRTKSCLNVVCAYGEVCKKGRCVIKKKSCFNVRCPANQKCKKGKCVEQATPSPCLDVRCPEGQVCQDGHCVVLGKPGACPESVPCPDCHFISCSQDSECRGAEKCCTNEYGSKLCVFPDWSELIPE